MKNVNTMKQPNKAKPGEKPISGLSLDDAMRLAIEGKLSETLEAPKESKTQPSPKKKLESLKNFKNDPLEIIWFVEGDDMADCPACKKEFDICKAYFTDRRCPFCGQKYTINSWIS